MKISIKLIVFLLFFICPILIYAQSGKNPLSFQTRHIENSIEISIDSGECTIQKNGEYDELKIEGCQNLKSPGDPSLPCRLFRILLPPNADLSAANLSLIEKEENIIQGKFNIIPSPPTISWEGNLPIKHWGGNDKKVENEKNVNVYNAADSYPPTIYSFISTDNFRKYKIINFEFYPIHYNPMDGILKQIKKIKIKINYETSLKGGKRQKAFSKDTFVDNFARQILDNFEQIAPYYFNIDSSFPSMSPDQEQQLASTIPTPYNPIDPGILETFTYDYVIITTDYLAHYNTGIYPNLSYFENFKENQGYNVLTVVEDGYYDDLETTKTSNCGWSFDDDPLTEKTERLRTYLCYYYAHNTAINYILLIGHPDPAHIENPSAPISVPMKKVYPYSEDEQHRHFTDYYYAEYDNITWNRYPYDAWVGNWNDNEYQSPPSYDTVVGRLPIFNTDSDYPYNQLGQMLGNNLSHQIQTGDISWRRNVLLPARDLNSGIWGDAHYYGERILTMTRNRNWNKSTRIYDNQSHPDVYTSNELNPLYYYYTDYYTSAIVDDYFRTENIWKHNLWGLMTWWTHGNRVTGMGVLYANHVRANPSMPDYNQCVAIRNPDNPSFCFLNSCNNAWPITEDILSSNMASELMYHAAVCVVAATGLTEQYAAPTSGMPLYHDQTRHENGMHTVNPGLGFDWCSFVIDNLKAGDILFQRRYAYSFSDWREWNNDLSYNYFGDPTIRINDNGNNYEKVFQLYDTSNNCILSINENGDMFLKGYVKYPLPIEEIIEPPNIKVWKLEDNNSIRAMLELEGVNVGRLHLKGQLKFFTTPPEPNIFCLKHDGVPIASVDANGDYYLKGDFTYDYENP